MQFTELTIPGAYKIALTLQEDERGFFARTFCQEEFGKRGLGTVVAQCSLSFNARRGTLRGMHYQRAPHAEAKVVRCIRGSIDDVIVDLRPASPAYRRWCSLRLSAENRDSVSVPEGCAHGFLTLEDATEVLYQMSAAYDADAAAGVRWDDPAFGIRWPFEPVVISQRDMQFPLI